MKFALAAVALAAATGAALPAECRGAGNGDAAPPALGACAHVTRAEWSGRERTFAMMREAGLGWVRSDFDWRAVQKEPDGPFDWSRYDEIVDCAERHGIKVLPIVGSPPKWERPVQDHPDGWRSFVRAFAEHYAGRIEAAEIWNEENIPSFWPNPDPAAYAETLRIAAEEIRAAAPDMKIVIGGLAGGRPHAFVEALYASGAAPHFDAMAFHPYSWPNPPDVPLAAQIRELRAIMAKHGDGGKPIWITEHGWPTHRASIPARDMLFAGLRVAAPERVAWRVAYADAHGDVEAGRPIAGEIATALPEGSTTESCGGADFARRLDSGEFDAVVYPFTEDFPLDTFDAVARFVERGGVLVDFGGCPMYYPFEGEALKEQLPDGAPVREEAWRRLGIEVLFPTRENGLSGLERVFATDEAIGAGMNRDPNGLQCSRFFGRGLLRDGDEMVALATADNAIGACVIRRREGGALILAGCGGDKGGLTEKQQADYLLRSIEIAAREDVKAYFIFEFRAPETDPYYSEHNFGIVHDDFSPKEAYRALRRRFSE